jgi:hypothetical protein
MTDLADIEKKLDRVLEAIARPAPRLLTIPECARMYRIGKDEVRAMIDAGELKAATRKPRRGSIGYMVDAKDAERLLGAR